MVAPLKYCVNMTDRQRIKAWQKDPIVAPLHYENLHCSVVGDDSYDTRYM